MNLIKQLGGHEKAKEFLSKGVIAEALKINEFSFIELQKQLLQYRREHNIFEVGDKVVIRRTDGHPEIFTYESVSASGNMHFFESPFNYGHLDLCKIRHATDEEIKAGHRI